MFFRFSTLLSSIALGLSLLKEIKLIVFVFSTLISPVFFSFFMEFATAVGETFNIFEISLWLSFSPAFWHNKAKTSSWSCVHFSLYMSILVYVCKAKFIYLSVYWAYNH